MTTLPPILRLGFRPFFLAAGVYAALGMAAWGLAWFTAWPPTAIPAPLWHAHEMLYGYALAVVAGFLLTAVRNWTGLPTARGSALAALLALWCAARLGYFLGPAALPYVAALDLSFDLLLLAAVATPIVRVRQWRQAGILAKLVLLTTGNALFYLGVMGQLADGTFYALHGGVFVLVALILTIAGRVMPGFIARGVRVPVEVRDPRGASLASLLLFLAFFVVELGLRDPRWAAWPAAALAAVVSWRLLAWHTAALWREPLLWGLYLALVAIATGFLLYALAPWWPFPRTLALHALAAGGIGLATLAMMSRVALGHTGRDIRRPPASVAPALLLLTGALTARVFLPLVAPTHYGLAVGLAQALWVAAFAFFAFAYTPILLGPRIDGQDG